MHEFTCEVRTHKLAHKYLRMKKVNGGHWQPILMHGVQSVYFGPDYCEKREAEWLCWQTARMLERIIDKETE